MTNRYSDRLSPAPKGAGLVVSFCVGIIRALIPFHQLAAMSAVAGIFSLGTGIQTKAAAVRAVGVDADKYAGNQCGKDHKPPS